MDYQAISDEMIDAVGGAGNIASVAHCVTRLRLVLIDEGKANDEVVKKIEGVKGLMKANGQYQVIIGQEVPDVAAVVAEKAGRPLGEVAADDDDDILKVPEAKPDDKLFDRFIRMISACIFPLVGLLISGGMIKGILTIATSAGVLQTTDGTYILLNAAASATMYYLPILVGFIAGRTFGANQYLTAVIGAIMVYPDVIAAYSAGEPLTFMGIPVILANYANQLFPILLAAWVASKVERFWKRVLPRMVQLMLVPFCTLIVVTPLAFLVIGPVMTWVSSILATIVNTLISISPTLAGAVRGAFWQVLIMLGVARAFSPIMMNNMTTLGYDPIMAMTSVTVFALAGAGLGYMIRQRSAARKSEALTLSLTAFLGVTEPIIYTVALPQKTPFVASWVGGALGGAIIGFTGVASQAYGGGGIFGFLLMVAPDNAMNLVWSVVAALVSTVVSFVVALFICKDAEGADIARA